MPVSEKGLVITGEQIADFLLKLKEGKKEAAEVEETAGEAAKQLDFDELGDPPAFDEAVDELPADEDFSQENGYEE